MSGSSYSIRRALPTDAGNLAVLGPATFRETFGNEFPRSAIDARMAVIYAPDRLRTDLADSDQTWFVALAGEEIIGFLALGSESAPDCVAGPRPMELSRLYLRGEWHGRGPAFALMEAGLAEAAARGAGTLWLQAWERNSKALAFYRAHGFRRSGEVCVSFAGQELPHVVMVRSLRCED